MYDNPYQPSAERPAAPVRRDERAWYWQPLHPGTLAIVAMLLLPLVGLVMAVALNE